MSFKLKEILDKASQDAIRALIWAQGSAHIVVANPAAAKLARLMAEAREQLGAKPQQKTAKVEKTEAVKEELVERIDVRFVLAVLLQARKSLIESMSAALDKAADLADRAKAKLAKACKAMQGWSNRLLAQSLGLGAARAALMLDNRMEEAERKLTSFICA